MTVGRPLDVGDITSRSVRLLLKNPRLFLPFLVAAVVSAVEGLLGPLLYSLEGIPALALLMMGLAVVYGSNSLMVQEALDGGKPSAVTSLREALRRFWTLAAVGIILTLLVIALGLTPSILESIIVLLETFVVLWYVYTIPAVMLERKGLWEGMKASRAFARDKKSSTFVILMILGLVALVIESPFLVVSLLSPSSPLSLTAHFPSIFTIVDLPLFVAIAAWFGTATSYTYIAYGMASAPAQLQASPIGTQPVRFCPSCGAPVPQGGVFCYNCGKPL